MVDSPQSWKKQEVRTKGKSEVPKSDKTKVADNSRVPSEPVQILTEPDKQWELTLAEGWHRGK